VEIGTRRHVRRANIPHRQGYKKRTVSSVEPQKVIARFTMLGLLIEMLRGSEYLGVNIPKI
jgi:hypothetical protein